MPNVPVRLWGPAHDMTMTSGGYFAELSDGKFLRTTAFIVPAIQTSKAELQTFVKPDLQPLNNETMHMLLKSWKLTLTCTCLKIHLDIHLRNNIMIELIKFGSHVVCMESIQFCLMDKLLQHFVIWFFVLGGSQVMVNFLQNKLFG